MTGPDHYREAEVMAQRAEGLLNAGDPENLASVWTALSQAHATLALAAAAAVRTPDEERAWLNIAATKLSGGGTDPGPRR